MYADHDRLLAGHGALDFGDLILHAFRLLHEKPHVRERVAARFPHVLVDEYQDTNFAQGALLRLLCQDHRNVTAVGDDDQAIYRFRGASQKNMLDFQREYEDCKVVRLERNYRSGSGSSTPRHAVVAGARPDREAAARRQGRRGAASGARAPRARRRRRWPPRSSGWWRRRPCRRRRSACWCAR